MNKVMLIICTTLMLSSGNKNVNANLVEFD